MNGKVSVIMPVYHGERYLKQAIDSILNQTYCNLELLIMLEYGSNQQSVDIVSGYTDNRIRVIKNKEKLGLAASLNLGLKNAEGEFIARMDADDRSSRKRIEIQVNYLKKHPDIAMCGSYVRINGTKAGRKVKTWEEIRFESFFSCPFFHPSVMWRKEIFEQYNLCYKTDYAAEDYELWMRVLDCVRAVNLGKPLVYYRIHENNRSGQYKAMLLKEDFYLKKEYWNRNGMEYFMPEKEVALCTYQNLWEKQMLEYINHTAGTAKNRRLIEKKAFDTYMLGYPLTVRNTYKRYTGHFMFLYSEIHLNKFRLFLYCIYRTLKRRCRLLLKWPVTDEKNSGREA